MKNHPETFFRFRAGLSAFLLAVSILVLVPGSAKAQQTPDRQVIENIIREYLLENPRILIEMQDVLERRQNEETASRQKKALEDRHDVIYSSKSQIEIGNPDAEIIIVEFFDYNCGFCQRALNDMNQLLENNKNVRFVLKEFPVLGETSVNAHRVSLAFAKIMPEKYADFHRELLGLEGGKDGERAIQLAVSMGADEAEIRAGMEDPTIIDAIREVYDIADELGISGTPSYVIGNEVIFGAVGYAQLADKVSNLSTD